ncbi:MAG: SNF2-related protein [Desulfobacterium sp.]|nr:SNF2-related protein [Desulfobacterium sp.]
MAKFSKEKKQQKRKAKQKQATTQRQKEAVRGKGEMFLEFAHYALEDGDLDKAAGFIKKAARFLPNDSGVINAMGEIGSRSGDEALELEAVNRLEKIGQFDDYKRVHQLYLTVNLHRFQEGFDLADRLLGALTSLKIKEKVKIRKDIQRMKDYCHYQLMNEKAVAANKKIRSEKTRSGDKTKGQPDSRQPNARQNIQSNAQPRAKADTKDTDVSRVVSFPSDTPKKLPPIPVTFNFDRDSFFNTLSTPNLSTPFVYDLAIESHFIRFKESFETLVCLASLSQVRSYWYQEETAKKVLKRFRGRALLSDEVGLGKTIEALIVLSEYMKRGMVKTGLILTPTPLVSQWKEEMSSKFGLDIPSTDDPDFKKKGDDFWKAPFILASINQAKSKNNFDIVTARQYDMLIVDEAHHLKNRTTLNWKLVNAIQKRFVLLLTATPVENNLMELYNLITLLKPGQLETATSFREKFMTKGDPTDPRNRAQLKELLQEVMIRNTRALAGINIPPRFAQTIRIEPTKSETAFYARLAALLTSLNRDAKGRGRLATKNLLAQAGSSPKAVEGSILRMLEKKEYRETHEEELTAVKNLCRTSLDTPKNKALLKLIQASREKMIVFVKYMGTLEHLREFLEWNNISFAIFHGSMDNRRKDAEIEAFKDEKKVLITTEIGGEGRNLQFCCQMVNYDLPWNPMKIEQRIGRIHRIGQGKEVHIFNFCAAGSIEDYILDILDKKINMFEMVVGEIDMILGRIRGEKEFEDLVYDIWIDSGSVEDRENGFKALGTQMKRARTSYEKTRELDDKLFGDSYEL